MKLNYTPVNQSERIALIDILRGFALFGILMVNLPTMFSGINLEISSFGNGDLSIPQILVKLFFEGKIYIIFSFLFGYGFWLFMSKETDRNILPVFRRRLLFLLLFGISHVVFLWAGDILIAYALSGFVLILFRKSSNKKIFGWSMSILLTLLTLNILTILVLTITTQSSEAQTHIIDNESSSQEIAKNIISIYSTGDYFEIMNVRLQEYKLLIYGIFYPIPFTMFLIGLLIAKKGYISNWIENLPKIRKTFWWTLIVGLLINTTYVILISSYSGFDNDFSKYIITSLVLMLGQIPIAFCYGSGIILLYAKRKGDYFFDLLSSAGRMALTNYLCQSIIGAFLAYPFGLGLFGKVDPWQSIILVITIFVTQAHSSRWWLKKFYFGPFEWLWRSLTYLKIQPFKRK